jgi:putative phosphoesterase
MIRVGLLSDTHNYLDPGILEHFKECDEIWHAGDIGTAAVTDELARLKPLRAVYGNIDGADIRRSFPEHQRFMCEQVDVWITHIGGYPKKYDKRVREEIRDNSPQLFICGHSHILKVIYDKDLKLLHVNPGAAGKYGFQKVRTVVRFSIDGKDIKNMEVIELGKR